MIFGLGPVLFSVKHFSLQSSSVQSKVWLSGPLSDWGRLMGCVVCVSAGWV